MKMKNSILTGALMFAAGVGCTVVAQVGWSPPRSSPEELEKHVNDLLVEVSHLGTYVTLVEKGNVWVNIDPIRCPTPIPQPKLPINAVDLASFQQGMAALATVENAYLNGARNPMRYDDKCQVAR